MKFHIYFECFGTVTEADIEADSKEDAVRIWENQTVSDYIKTEFGLFFLQPTYAEMVAAAHDAADSVLVVTRIDTLADGSQVTFTKYLTLTDAGAKDGYYGTDDGKWYVLSPQCGYVEATGRALQWTLENGFINFL